MSRSSTLLRQLNNLGRRQLSTTTTTNATARLPWFVDPTPFVRQKVPHLVQGGPAPLPEGVPTAIKNLHAVLKNLPPLGPIRTLGLRTGTDASRTTTSRSFAEGPAEERKNLRWRGYCYRYGWRVVELGRSCAGKSMCQWLAVSVPTLAGSIGKGRNREPRRNRGSGARRPQIRKQKVSHTSLEGSY